MGKNKRDSGGNTVKKVSVNFNVRVPKGKNSGNSGGVVLPVGEMHLAKICNRYMIPNAKPEQEHTYAVYVDEKTKEVRAIETTHLYLPDKENMEKVKKGLLRKVKFDSFETPSAINNYYYNTNLNGGPIDLSHSDVRVDKTPLPQGQAMDIRRFANKLRKR